jgi:hypothetical protein
VASAAAISSAAMAAAALEMSSSAKRAAAMDLCVRGSWNNSENLFFATSAMG